MSLSFTPQAAILFTAGTLGKITLGFQFIKVIRFSKARGKSHPPHLIIELTNSQVPVSLYGEEAIKDGKRLQRVLDRKRRVCQLAQLRYV